ncbi:MAG: hypothetical protein ACRCVU_08720 [Flavobacterium sp.]
MRKVYAEVPSRIEYFLTDIVKELLPIAHFRCLGR